MNREKLNDYIENCDSTEFLQIVLSFKKVCKDEKTLRKILEGNKKIELFLKLLRGE